MSSTAELASFAEVVVKVTVNFDLCASTGACAQVAPEVFVVRNDGYLHILQEQPSPELYDVVQEAADLCPTGAITLED
ncbi:MAG: ferredoxin [Ilumatobacteraceae bacterium]